MVVFVGNYLPILLRFETSFSSLRISAVRRERGENSKNTYRRPRVVYPEWNPQDQYFINHFRDIKSALTYAWPGEEIDKRRKRLRSARDQSHANGKRLKTDSEELESSNRIKRFTTNRNAVLIGRLVLHPIDSTDFKKHREEDESNNNGEIESKMKPVENESENCLIPTEVAEAETQKAQGIQL